MEKHENGTCVKGKCVPASGEKCDDGNPCTEDVCEKGGCVHNFYNDKAEHPCNTYDECASGEVCKNKTCTASSGLADGALCTDNNPCTKGDACKSFRCVAAEKVADSMPCDDGNECTTGASCADGVCTAATPKSDGETCVGGTCKSGLYK